MANKKISELIATAPVVTSLETDQFETNQGGTSKGALNSQNLKVPTIHTNVARVTVLSPAGEQTLLDSAASRALADGNVLRIEGFGSFLDPGANNPNVVFRLKIGATTIILNSAQINHLANWFFYGMLTIRSAGAAGSVTGAFHCAVDNVFALPFSNSSATVVVNTTGAPNISLTAQIDNVLGTEAVICDQLVITKVY